MTPRQPIPLDLADLRAERVTAAREIANRLRDAAATARDAPRGRHPSIPGMTHASALLYAAQVADDYAEP